MRREAAVILGVGVLALCLFAFAGSVAVPRHAAVSRAVEFSSPDPAPSEPPTTKEICDQLRQTTAALGPGLPQRFREQGLPPAQVLETVRTLYQLAEAEVAKLRGQTAEPGLQGALAAIEAQYRDIYGRLASLPDLDRVNFASPALAAAVANSNRICG